MLSFDCTSKLCIILSNNFQFIFAVKNALQNLVIELCSALKIFQKYLLVFIKATHSFVVIELTIFLQKCKIPF